MGSEARLEVSREHTLYHWRYARVYVTAVGFVGMVALISFFPVAADFRENRASFVGTLVVLIVAWSPVLLIARRWGFAVAAYAVAGYFALVQLATAGTVFPGLWMATSPMLVAAVLPRPPRDAWTYGVLGATAIGCLLFAAAVAATIPAW